MYQKYLIKPTEIHARIGELRRQFNLKPDQVLDNKKVREIISAGLDGKTTVDSKFFDLIEDPIKFKWLMNNAPVKAGIIAGAGAGALSTQKKGGITKLKNPYKK